MATKQHQLGKTRSLMDIREIFTNNNSNNISSDGGVNNNNNNSGSSSMFVSKTLRAIQSSPTIPGIHILNRHADICRTNIVKYINDCSTITEKESILNNEAFVKVFCEEALKTYLKHRNPKYEGNNDLALSPSSGRKRAYNDTLSQSATDAAITLSLLDSKPTITATTTMANNNKKKKSNYSMLLNSEHSLDENKVVEAMPLPIMNRTASHGNNINSIDDLFTALTTSPSPTPPSSPSNTRKKQQQQQSPTSAPATAQQQQQQQIKKHKCNGKCTNTKRPFTVYCSIDYNSNTGNAPTGYPYDRKITEEMIKNYHVCIPGICPFFDEAASMHNKDIMTNSLNSYGAPQLDVYARMMPKDMDLHKIRLFDFQEFWICERTRTFHMCGDFCFHIEERRMKEEYIASSGMTCPITQNVVGADIVDIVSSRKSKLKIMNDIVDYWKQATIYSPINPAYHYCSTTDMPASAMKEVPDIRLLLERSAMGLSKSKKLLTSGSNGNTTTCALPSTEGDQYHSASAATTSNGNKKCDIHQLKTTIYTVYDMFSERKSSSCRYHLCIEGYCRDAAKNPQEHKRVAAKIEEVYVCAESGNHHFCGDFCDRSCVNKDGMNVCDLTGRVSSSPVMRDDYYDPNDNMLTHQLESHTTGSNNGNGEAGAVGNYFSAPANESNSFGSISNRVNSAYNDSGNKGSAKSSAAMGKKYNNKRFEVAEALQNEKMDIDSMTMRSEDFLRNVYYTELRRKGDAIRARNKREEFYMISFTKISVLFSKKQLELEDRFRNSIIKKDLDSASTRHIHKSLDNKHHVNGLELLLVMMNQHKKKDGYVRFSLTNEQRVQLAGTYTRYCIALWYILLTRTQTGINNPELFLPYKDFIFPALQVMQKGVIISDATSPTRSSSSDGEATDDSGDIIMSDSDSNNGSDIEEVVAKDRNTTTTTKVASYNNTVILAGDEILQARCLDGAARLITKLCDEYSAEYIKKQIVEKNQKDSNDSAAAALLDIAGASGEHARIMNGMQFRNLVEDEDCAGVGSSGNGNSTTNNLNGSSSTRNSRKKNHANRHHHTNANYVNKKTHNKRGRHANSSNGYSTTSRVRNGMSTANVTSNSFDSAEDMNEKLNISPIINEWNGRKKSQNETMVADIENALIRAVLFEGVAPSDLQYTSVDYESIDIDKMENDITATIALRNSQNTSGDSGVGGSGLRASASGEKNSPATVRRRKRTSLANSMNQKMFIHKHKLKI